ncbi:MAG: hypothetical protein ABMA14_28060, partial [Hyphomonadaceae bacterium]
AVGLEFMVARSTTAAANVNGSGDGFVGSPPVITTTAAGQQITRGTDTILISKVQLVIRDAKLESALAQCNDDDNDEPAPAAVAGFVAARDGRGDSDDDDCPSIRVGPFLVDVPVNGANASLLAVAVPEGTYSAVRLRLHAVTGGDSADLAFRTANPAFQSISVRLEGTFHGAPFVFTGDVDARIAVPLTEPIAIKAGGDNITVSIDLSKWFLRPQGGLYSPASANASGSVRSAVQANIRAAFRAFCDRDRDGRED